MLAPVKQAAPRGWIRGSAAGVLVGVLASLSAAAAMPVAAQPPSSDAAIRAVLIRFARAAYADDGNTLCALTTPSEQQALVAEGGFSGGSTYTPCRETLKELYTVFVHARPVRPLSEIAANWSQAPIHLNEDTATVTVLSLATGPPFPAAPARTTLALLRHNGQWLMAVSCAQIAVCNRFPAPGDAAAIRAVVTPWQLTNVGYGHLNGAALCSLLTPTYRRMLAQVGREMAPARTGCAAYLNAALLKIKRTKPRYTRAQVKADMAAEVIHVVGNNATVTMRNLDFSGSANWILDWINGHWLLATLDG